MCNEIKKANAWYKGQKKGARVMLELLTTVVTCYLVFLLWLLPQMMATVPMDTKYWKVKILVALVAAVPVYLGLKWCVYKSAGLELRERKSLAVPGKEKKYRLFWFALGAGIVFLVLMVYYYAYFPGSFDWDNLDQWWQIQNHQYDTWHPVFHTLIIAFFSKIVNHYGFAVFMQLLLYSLVCGYLMYTLAKWRFPVWGLVLTEFFLAANPQTHRILLFMEGQRVDGLYGAVCRIPDQYLENQWKLAEKKEKSGCVYPGTDFHFHGAAQRNFVYDSIADSGCAVFQRNSEGMPDFPGDYAGGHVGY